MALLNKRLTDRETAAIYLHIFGGVDDWRLLYAIADNGPEKDREKVDRSVASKWKNSAKIIDLIEKVTREKYAIIQTAEKEGLDKGRAERTETETGAGSVRADNAPNLNRSKYVDFSDPSKQMDKLNELVNTADDPGEALDALKVIMQSQRADRDAAKDKQIQRFYTPERCSRCAVKQAFAKLTKKGQK
jgi:hypothetical protein